MYSMKTLAVLFGWLHSQRDTDNNVQKYCKNLADTEFFKGKQEAYEEVLKQVKRMMYQEAQEFHNTVNACEELEKSFKERDKNESP